MFVEFRVKNFRSIRDETVLSLVASSDKDLSENVLDSGVTAIPRLLSYCVIYGANAGGKTNLIRALGYMRSVVQESATMIKPGQTYNIQSFAFDKGTKSEDTEFEITFVLDGVRYQYGFAMNPNRISEEWLLVYKSSRPQEWFSRKYDDKNDRYEYKFSSYFHGSRNLWKESTRENVLFLSNAVHLNSEQLKPIFDWLINDLVVLPEGGHIPPDYTIDQVRNHPGMKSSVMKFLSSADISISDIEIKKEKGWKQTFKFKEAEATSQKVEETDVFLPFFEHKTSSGSGKLGLEDESSGTRKLFVLSGPLIDIVKKGKTLIVDELDVSLHTLLVKNILSLFQSASGRNNPPQLIFTTHNTSLLDKTYLRRDQVWLMEKDEFQASKLNPLTDFKPRKKEAIQSGYLSGRYGAVPFLEDFEVL